MEGEFQRWLDSFEYEHQYGDYDGYDYDKNRIDGTFSFTDPKCE